MQPKTCEKCGSSRLAVDVQPDGWSLCQSCGHSMWNGREAGEIKPVDDAAPTIPPPPEKFDPQLRITRGGMAMWEEEISFMVVPSISRRINLNMIAGYYYPDETEGNRTVVMLPNGANFFIYGDHRGELDAWFERKI